MRGDWKDQQLNQQYQKKLMYQAEQTRLTQVAPKSHTIYLRIFVLQNWLSNLFHPRRFVIYASEPALKTQKLRTVK